MTINVGIGMMGPDEGAVLVIGPWKATSRDQSREGKQHPVLSMVQYDMPE